MPATSKLRRDPARIAAIIDGLEKLYPEVECELVHESPLQLLVATILSAQCTDARVNMVTPELFRRYPDARALAEAETPELENIIRSTGFYHNKAKNIQGAARMLVEKFGGEVPRTMDELLELPGVARKTANVVLGTAFGIAVGVVVDTHVMRLSHRLGLTREQDPIGIEQDLMKIIPQQHWIRWTHQLIWHGRRVCDARKPRCEDCLIAPACPSAGMAAADAPHPKKEQAAKRKAKAMMGALAGKRKKTGTGTGTTGRAKKLVKKIARGIVKGVKAIKAVKSASRGKRGA